MSNTNNQRFPSPPSSLTLEEITKQWSELTRLLENQNRQMSQKKVLRTNIKTTDTDFNVNEEGILLVDASVSTRSVYLNNARNTKENVFWVKRIDSNASNNVLIVAASAETIDTTTEVTVGVLGTVGIVSDGENYWVISN